MDEVLFIVNLYNFLPPLVLQENLSFTKESHLPRTTLKTPSLFFCESLFFEDISTPRSEWQTVLITTLVLQDWPQRYILSFFYKFSGALSLSRMVVEFSLRHLYFTQRVKNFQIYGLHISGKCIDLRNFCACPPELKLSPKFLSSHSIGKRKLLISHDLEHYSWLGTLLMTWNIRFCIFCKICNLLKCDSFIVFKIVSII